MYFEDENTLEKENLDLGIKISKDDFIKENNVNNISRISKLDTLLKNNSINYSKNEYLDLNENYSVSKKKFMTDFENEKNNLLVKIIMETGILLSYGDDKETIIPTGVFYPVSIDEKQNVVYQKKENDYDSPTTDEEVLRIPLVKVLLYLNNNSFDLYYDEFLGMLSSEQPVTIEEINSFSTKPGVIYGLDELAGQYHTNSIKRGQNYSVVPFEIGKTLKKVLTRSLKKEPEKSVLVNVEEPTHELVLERERSFGRSI